jgi:lipopolysaccharide export system protein LptA
MVSAVSRFRRWFAFGAILMVAIVAGMYFYAQWSIRKVVHTIPAKLGVDIQQTAEGFSISKSEEGRTIFKVSASRAVQFKEGGRAALHNVKIVVFGKDDSRFDRIAGDDFEYDPSSGDVTAKGRVLIDLQANPEGMKQADQTPPQKLKDPLHLETVGLVFNKNTGDASATGQVIFQTPQASGSAVGIRYVAKTGTMNLLSAVEMTVSRPQPVHLKAVRGVITKQPREIVLNGVHMTREQQQMEAEQATFFLRDDNTVDRVLAEGDVRSQIRGTTSNSETRSRSDQAELFLSGTRNLLTTAVLTGNVRLSNGERASLDATDSGVKDIKVTQPAEADAGRITLHFKGQTAGQQVLDSVHAENGVRLFQNNNPSASAIDSDSAGIVSSSAKNSQDIEMTAPVMDFTVKGGRLLERAVTSGPPQIVITQPAAKQMTVVTAGKFIAKFTDKNRLATLHGEPDTKIVSSSIAASAAVNDKPGSTTAQSDRVSTSKMLDVVFLPEGGISSITQSGSLIYVDGTEKAWAQRGDYTTSDQMLVLGGSPRVVDNGMTTTAKTMRLNRATGDAFAEGSVKSTYSDLKAQPNGALLASSDPIHVTGQSMTAHRTSAIAVYTGDARLWQDANVVEAPTLQFDRDHRSIIAQGTSAQPVSTVLVQIGKDGKVTPVHITSARLEYADSNRTIFLDGGVTTKATDATITGPEMTVFLKARSQSQTGSSAGTNLPTPGQVERIVADQGVTITQPTRHATGEKLVYTAANDEFVLTGGSANPPSIFDAERGKISGDLLTFYRHDDKVLVEGKQTSPTVTQTHVAR